MKLLAFVPDKQPEGALSFTLRRAPLSSGRKVYGPQNCYGRPGKIKSLCHCSESKGKKIRSSLITLIIFCNHLRCDNGPSSCRRTTSVPSSGALVHVTTVSLKPCLNCKLHTTATTEFLCKVDRSIRNQHPAPPPLCLPDNAKTSSFLQANLFLFI
jgi:hypothetical protein